MKISQSLNLVVPIEREGQPLYVHSTPLATPVFDRYFLIISKTFSQLYGHGLGQLGGARVASMMLRKVAIELDDWEGPEGAELGLMGEIRRMSNVMAMTEEGWKLIPLQEAIDRGQIDAQEISEMENLIVFFMLGSAMLHKAQRPVLAGALGMWGAQVSSQSCTELLSSLRTSTETAVSEPKVPLSSIPS